MGGQKSRETCDICRTALAEDTPALSCQWEEEEIEVHVVTHLNGWEVR